MIEMVIDASSVIVLLNSLVDEDRSAERIVGSGWLLGSSRIAKYNIFIFLYMKWLAAFLLLTLSPSTSLFEF